MSKKCLKRGGKRIVAGRPRKYKEEKIETISFRVLCFAAPQIKELFKKLSIEERTELLLSVCSNSVNDNDIRKGYKYPLPKKINIEFYHQTISFKNITGKFENQFNHFLFCEKVQELFDISIEYSNFDDNGYLIISFLDSCFDGAKFDKFKNSKNNNEILEILISCL